MGEVTRGPVKTVEVGGDATYETTSESITVVLVRSDQEELPLSWVEVDGEWRFAKGVEIFG